MNKVSNIITRILSVVGTVGCFVSTYISVKECKK